MQKKITFLLVMLLCIPWMLKAQTVVAVDETFNNAANGTTLPTGWLRTGNISNSYNWSVSSSSTDRYDGKYLRMQNYGEGDSAIVQTPVFDLTVNMSLSFMCYNAACRELKIFLVYTENGQNQKVLLQDCPNTTGWVQYFCDLREYTGKTGARIMFQALASYQLNGKTYSYLDNIRVFETPLCAQPVDVGVASLTKNSATLSWNNHVLGSPSNNFTLTLRDANGNNIYNNTPFTTAGFNLYQITGLQPNSTYTANIKADCTGSALGYSDISEDFTFNTPDTAINIPYAIDFEGLTELPAGWLIGSTRNPSNASISYVAHTGDNSLAVVPGYNTVQINAPAFAVPANSMEIDFYVQCTYPSSVKVGLISDLADLSSFNEIFSTQINTIGQWQNIRLNTLQTGYATTEDLHVCILISTTNAAGNVYIDDFRVYQVGTCTRLEQFKAEADSTNIHMSWSDFSVTPSGNYQIEYTNNSTNITNYVIGHSNPYTLSNVASNTSYTVRVRSICAVGDTSEWSMPVTLKTFCTPQPAEMNVIFANEGTTFDDCWTSVQTVLGTGASYSDYGSSGWDIYAHNGVKRARLRSAKEGGHYILATPALSIATPGQYDMTFSLYRFSSSKTGHEFKVWASHSIDTTDAVLLTNIARNYQGNPVESKSAYYNYEVNIPLSGAVYILFEGVHGASSSASYLDSIHIYPAPKCRQPKNIQVTPSLNTIDITWTPGETYHTAWKVNYVLYRSATDSTVFTGVVNTPSYSITGLIPGTAYHIKGYVATECEDTVHSVNIEFDEYLSTKCEIISTFPYVQDFEDVNTIPPTCWDRDIIKVATSGTNFGKETWTILNDPDKAYAGTGAGYFQKAGNGTVATFTSPQFKFQAGKQYQVRFWMYRNDLPASYNSLYLRAFVSDNANDTMGTRIANINICIASAVNKPAGIEETKAGWYEYIFEIPTNLTGNKYIVLAGINTSYYANEIIIDNFAVEEVPACRVIQRAHAELINYSSAYLRVEAESNVNWQYVAIKDNETIESATPVSVFGSDSTMITGLQDNTEYRVYVRRDCGNGVYSDWSSNPCYITTPCIEGRAPYLETFESYTVGKDITFTCFDFQRPSSYYSYPIIDKTALENAAYAGQKCLFSRYQGYLYRQFYLEAGKTYEMAIYALGDNDIENSYGDRISFFTASEPIYTSKINTIMEYECTPSSWTRIGTTFTVAETGYYYLGIDIQTNYGIGFDNWSVREIECVEPNNISFSSITTNSAELMFLQNGVQTEIRVATVNNGDLDPAFDVLIDTVSTNTVQITGLQPSNKYYYTLRSICANGSRSAWTTVSSFYTLCEPQAVPYSDTFEEDNTNFTCWSASGANHVAELSTNYSHRAGKSSVKLQNTTFISPELDVTSLAGYTVVGYLYSTTANVTVSLGVMGDPNSVESYEPISDINIPVANSWTEFNVSLAALAGDDYEGDPIADSKFVALYVGNQLIYLDNVQILPTVNCARPSNITINNFDPNNLNVSWTAGGTESSWEVNVYRMRTLSNGVVENVLEATQTVNANNVTLHNLYPTSRYYVTVKAICGATENSLEAYSPEFETGCASMSLPYYDDIAAGVEKGMLPTCWAQGESYPESTTNIWNAATNPNFPTLSGLYWDETGTNTIPYTTLITPSFDFSNVVGANITMSVDVINTDTMYIFASYDGGLTYTDTVGFMNPASGNASETRVIDAGKCAGREVMFAIRAKGIVANNSYYARINSFSIEPIENCLIPEGAIIGAQTNSSAKIVINDTVSTHSAWDYVVVPAGDRVTDGTPVTVNSVVFEIENLNSGFDYDIYIRSNCGNGEVSAWRGPITFTTKCSVVNLPYNEHFENEDACYQLFKPIDASPAYPRIELNSDFPYDGNNALRFVSSYELISAANSYLVLPKTNVPVQQTAVSFNYIQRNNSGKFIIGIVNGNDTSTFVSLDTLDYTDSYDYSYAEYQFNSLPAGYENYRIAVAFTVGVNYNNYSFIDNLRIYKTNEFKAISNIKINSVSTTSATVKIDYNADNIEVACVPQGSAPAETGNILSSDKLIAINGLTPATCYAVYARTHSGSEISEWFGPTYFYTECVVIDVTNGWTENFDTYNNPDYQIAPCFTPAETYTVNGEEYPKIKSSTISTLPNAMVMRGTNLLILPEFNFLPGQLEMSFYGIANNCDVVVGTIQDGDVESFTELEFVSLTNIVDKYTISFKNYYCPGNRIAFRTKMSSSIVYIDSIHVQIPSSTPEVVISHLDIADNTASVYWNAPASAITTTYTLYEAGNTTPVVTNSTNDGYVDLTGLTGNTNYVIEVRSTLPGNQYTATATASFTTKHQLLNVPFTIDFENDAENEAWNIVTDKTDRFIFGSNTAAVKSGNKALYVSNKPATEEYAYTKEANTIYATREVYLPAGTMNLSFDYKVIGYLTSDFGYVFLKPVDADMPTTSLSYGLPDGFISLGGALSNSSASAASWNSTSYQIKNNKAGIYELVVYWKASGYYQNQPALSVDNIVCDFVPCSILDNVQVKTTYQGATITYSGYNSGSTIHYTIFEGNDTITSGSVNGSTISITGLEPQTTYSYELYATCAQGEATPLYGEFNTGCIPLSAPWSYGFEDLNGDQSITAANPCWGESLTSSYYKFVGTTGNGTTNYDAVHHSGDQSLFYASGINSKAVLFNTFHFEAGKQYRFSVWTRTIDPLNLGNTISIVQVNDQNLVSKTFTSVELTDYWQKVSADIVMNVTGDYKLGFSVLHNNLDYNSQYPNIATTFDDMEFVEVVDVNPSPVTVSNITDTEAEINWRAIADSYRLIITSNGNEVINTIVSGANSYVATGLTSNTSYYVSVRGYINGDSTSVATARFTTECGVIAAPYKQNFDAVSVGTIPSCWDNTSNSVITKNSSNWSVNSVEGNNVLSLNTATANGLMSIQTVPVTITHTNTALTFKYNNESEKSKLYAVISNDGGNTLDTILIANRSSEWNVFAYNLDDYIGSDVTLYFNVISTSANAATISIDDLSINVVEYMPTIYDTICQGDNYYRNGFSCLASELNVGVNPLSKIKETTAVNAADTIVSVELFVAPQYFISLYDTICKGEVYNKGLFANVNPPITATGRYQQNFLSSFGCDSIVALYLTVLDLDSTINVPLCEGETYTFQGNTYTDAGTYTFVEQNANGCDVTTTINITVIPKYYDSTVARCDNESYEWEGRTITTTGVYTANYTNVNGCDSIMRLYYTALPTQVDTTIAICRGSYYDFAGTTLTEPGTYNHSFVSTFGCDSVVNLTLVVTDPTRTIVNDYVCEGDDYNGNGFNLIGVTADTIAELTMQTYAGCDSIIELHLTMIPAVYDTIYASINPGETYEFANNTYTQAGEYQGHFFTEGFGCDSIVTLILSVGTGVEGSYVLPIVVAPNPVLGGQSTYVTHEWTAEEQNGMRVEVLNSVGQVVEVFTPATYPIEVKGINVSGIYIIRVTSGTGNVYLGRLVVK